MKTLLNIILLLAIMLVLKYSPPDDGTLTRAGSLAASLMVAGAAGLMIAWLFDRLRKEGKAEAFASIRSASYKATLDGSPVIIVAAADDVRAMLDRKVNLPEELEQVRRQP